MIIPARKLASYFQKLTFPVEVRRESSEEVAYILSEPEMRQLCDDGLVIGVGSRSKIRHFRLNMPAEVADVSLEKLTDIKAKTVAARKFTYREKLPSASLVMLKRYNDQTGEFVRW